MRPLTFLLALALFGTATGALAADPIRVLGFLAEEGDKRCIEGRTEWVNQHYEVDFTRVVDSSVDLAPLVNKLVLVTGTPVEGYEPPAVEHEADCPMMQMRSDWVEGMRGIRIQRRGPAVAAMRVQAAEEWPNLSAKVDKAKGEIAVTVKNDLGAPLLVTMHYEGCYGKPGTVAREQTVEPGQKARTLRFPLIAERVYEHEQKGIEAGRQLHAAQSISLSARAEGLTAAADAPLRLLGVKSGCPAR